jgi:hypothetical protein
MEKTATVVEDSNRPGPAPEGVENWIVGPDSDVTPAVSVVMPTMNEEEGIAECISRIKRAVAELRVPTEIIISDSSTDRTPEVASELGAVVVEPDKMGYGYAYRCAFEHTRGGYIVMGDADTTYDFEQIPRLIEHLEETGADIVMGSRLDGEIKPGAMPPLHQYVGNPLLTRFLNVFYDAGVSDAHSGFRVLRRGVLDDLDFECDGMEFASEMVMKAGADGLTISEVPITYHEREGEATLDSFRDGWRHVRFMLVNAPGYLFSIPAFAFGFVGIMILSLSSFDGQLPGVAVGVHTALMGSLLAIVGFQVGSLTVFSAITADPIQAPSDAITQWIRRSVRLEHGATAGLGFCMIGAAYLTVRWITGSTGEAFVNVPNILAFTAIVIGIQTVFSSFFLSMIGTRTDH